MKRILNFVVILLTTLSIVNAVNIPLRKRAIAFAACPSGSPQFSAASIDPDPPVAGKTATAKVTFTVPATFESGKFAADATAGGKSIDGFPTEQDVCTIGGITCPIAAGSTVDIQTIVPIPDDVPDTYTLEYSLVDGTGKEIACSSGPVTGAAKAKGGDGGDGGPGGKGPDGAPDDGGPGGKGPDGAPDDGGPGGKGPDDGGPGGKGPDDGGPGGKGPDDGGPGGKGPDDGGPGGKGPDDGGPGGKGPDGAPDDGGPGGKGPPKGPKGPPKGPDGPDGPAKGGPPPDDGGDGGDGGP